ncbi:MAG: transcriptional regulator [Gammaproteobacteria bacterium]|nr:transcriptional regulator [Gammaproteobacteria bacterium]
MSSSERSAALLMQIIIHIESELLTKGITQETAEEIARGTCDKLRHTFGGEQFYFPKGREIEAILTHHQIYKKFNGFNHVELAREFDMSIQNIYRIIKKAYKKDVDELQPDLF